jgi:hypothetical protein
MDAGLRASHEAWRFVDPAVICTRPSGWTRQPLFIHKFPIRVWQVSVDACKKIDRSFNGILGNIPVFGVER